ncbi:MAG: site-2 protease family protein [Oscillospiraceae bacterium]|nr:site-2 protease family protein [Oscillospiraceae bacterium]
MIELRFYGVRIRVCFGFLFINALMTLFSGNIAVLALCACLLHELGHMAVMKLFGQKIYSVTFYGAGVKISPKKGTILTKWREAAVLCAGCGVNALLFMLFGCSPFGLINLFLCVFNMLPAGGLDGGRLLKLFLEESDKISLRTAEYICRAAGCITAVLLPFAAYCADMRNITVIIAAAFMLISALFR